jgi:hypothetical protein
MEIMDKLSLIILLVIISLIVVINVFDMKPFYEFLDDNNPTENHSKVIIMPDGKIGTTTILTEAQMKEQDKGCGGCHEK